MFLKIEMEVFFTLAFKNNVAGIIKAKFKSFLEINARKNLSHLMTKPTKWHVRPPKTQISLGIRPNS